MSTPDYRLDQLAVLESEATYIIREVAAELERPVLLFSAARIPSSCCGWRRRRSGPHRSPSR